MFLSPRWVDFLVAAGHDAVHWVDVGEPNAPDRMMLEHAHHNRLIILTQDLDFGTLLAAIEVAGEHPELGAERSLRWIRWIRWDTGSRSCPSAWVACRSKADSG